MTCRGKHNRHPTEKEIWEALKGVVDKDNPDAAIHSVHRYYLEYRKKDGALKKMKRKSVMEWLRKQRKLSDK